MRTRHACILRRPSSDCDCTHRRPVCQSGLQVEGRLMLISCLLAVSFSLCTGGHFPACFWVCKLVPIVASSLVSIAGVFYDGWLCLCAFRLGGPQSYCNIEYLGSLVTVRLRPGLSCTSHHRSIPVATSNRQGEATQ
jgi:hypothetical protein